MKILNYSEVTPETRALIRNFAWGSTEPLPEARRGDYEKAWREYSAAIAERNPDHLPPAPPWRTWLITSYRFEWLPEAERPCIAHTIFSMDCWWYQRGCLLDGRSDAFVVRGEHPANSPWLPEDLKGRVLI